MKNIIGIDIGGTKISVVFGTDQGNILEKRIIKTLVRDKKKQCLDTLVKTIESLLHDRMTTRDALLGIGVCIPGPIGSNPHIISHAPNLPGWNGFNIGEFLSSSFNVPVVCNNDANAACIAEKIFGHGKKSKDFLYITISTGVGSGLIINDQLVMGGNNSAGEIGHCMVEPYGPICNCGKIGCLEALSSGTAIASMAKDIVFLPSKRSAYSREFSYIRYKQKSDYRDFNLKQKSLLSTASPNEITARFVAEVARKGDSLANYIYWRAGFYFGIAVSHVLQIINPQMIAIGGSVSKTGSLYFSSMRKAIQEYTWRTNRNKCKIVKAKLRDNVGDYGSLGLIINNLFQ
jgi:glucokinase